MTAVLRITYFVHGTTTDNESGKASGWNDVGLSALGITQSKDLFGQLKGKKFDVVITSDLRRAVDSAKLTWGDSVPMIADTRLRECNYGDCNGISDEVMSKKMQECIEIPFPHGESYNDVEQRMRVLLKELCKKFSGKHVGFVAHRAPQLALDVILKGKSWQQAMRDDWRHTKSWKPGWEYELVCEKFT